jgi:hypothetical protein
LSLLVLAVSMVSGGASMTLVFERAALERLADPAAAFADAREWTTAIGLVSDEAPERLSAYADREDIDPDFISSARGRTGGLAVIRQQFTTERHVFVGTTDEDRGLAESLGWEYLPVTEAADAADWTLAADDDRWRGSDEAGGDDATSDGGA